MELDVCIPAIANVAPKGTKSVTNLLSYVSESRLSEGGS